MEILLDRPVLFGAVVFAALWLSLELGRRLARSYTDPSRGGAVGGAVFAVLSLLIAFTFSGAASRFDHRRDLIVSEANAIGTAYLRIDLVAADAQPALREAFARYTRSRAAAYAQVGEPHAFRKALAASAVLQTEIWQRAVAAGARPDARPAVNTVLLPALNEMIDITATRALAMLMHPPLAIYGMLFVLALTGAVLAGFGLGGGDRRDWLHMLCFALTMTALLYVIVDLEYPRLGLIDVVDFERNAIALAGAEYGEE